MDRFEHTDGRLLGITTDNASSNYWMTQEQQSTFEALGIRWPAMRNHLPCMAHVIQLVLGAFMSNVGVKGCTKSLEAHERDQQSGENESTNIGKSQRQQKEGNARLNMVSAMRPGLAKMIEQVCISRHSERSESNLHIAENACCVDYTDTWSSKPFHWLSRGQSTNHSTTCDGCENTVEFDSGVAWASLPIMRIHLPVAEESKIQRLQATLHKTGWMDNGQVHHGSFEAIPILDPVDVEMAYSYFASCHHCLQWHVWSYWWLCVSFGWEQDAMEGRIVLRCKGCAAEAVQILWWRHSNDRSVSHFGTYPWAFPEVANIQEVCQGEAYKSQGRDFLNYPIQGNLSGVCRERILCQTSTNVRLEQWKCSTLHYVPLWEGFWIRSIVFWSTFFVQRQWSLHNT